MLKLLFFVCDKTLYYFTVLRILGDKFYLWKKNLLKVTLIPNEILVKRQHRVCIMLWTRNNPHSTIALKMIY